MRLAMERRSWLDTPLVSEDVAAVLEEGAIVGIGRVAPVCQTRGPHR